MKILNFSDQNFVLAAFFILFFPLVVNMLPFGVVVPPVFGSVLFGLISISRPQLFLRRDISITLVMIFIIWSIASVLLFLFPHNPADVAAFMVGVNVALLPVLGFFLAYRLKTEGEIKFVITKMVIFHAFIVGISIVLHFTRPDFYTNFLFSMLGDVGYQDISQFYARLQGPLGSTAMGVLCCSAVFLMPMVQLSSVNKALLILLFFAASFLTFQRSSMFLMAFAVLLSLRSFGPKVRFVFIALSSLISFTALSNFADSDLLQRILGRVGEINEVLRLEGRSSYGIVLENLPQYLLGFGLGASTSIADARGYNPGGQIVDANHMRIMADLGLVGLFLFMLTFFVSVMRARWIRMLFPLTIAVLAYQLQGLGSNVFDAFYIGQLYWFYLGLLGVGVLRLRGGGSEVPKLAMTGVILGGIRHPDN